MLNQSLKASRATLGRIASRRAPAMSRTYVAATGVRKADQIQDMYLRELQRTKPAEVKASDAAAHVQKFTKPKTPASPEESSLSGELNEYKGQAVEVEGHAATETSAPAEQDWFEEEEENEEELASH